MDFVNGVCGKMIESGIEPKSLEIARNSLILELENWKIEKAETALAIYEGDQNEYMIKKFLISKKVAGCSDRTIEYYSAELCKFFDRVGKHYQDVTSDDIILIFARREMADKASRVTINNERRVISSFYTWLVREEAVIHNPILKIDKLKTKKTKKEAFTELEIEKIRDACRSERETAMIEILLSTGCRISELVQMKISELEDDKIIVHGKGGKDRIVYLNAKAQNVLTKYLACRKDENPYIFTLAKFKVCEGKLCKLSKADQTRWYKFPEFVREDGHMDASAAEGIIRKIGKRAGVEKTHPHRFRRTCATFALRRGMPIEQVSIMLGHEQISTTQVYLDLTESELEQAHRKYVV